MILHAKENKFFYNDTIKTCNNKCIIILNILEKAVSASSDEIISLIELGTRPFIPICYDIWVPRLLSNTHKLLYKWIIACQTDASAFFIAFSAGSGYNKKLVRPRYLTNAYGLSPIRTRIVSYLVHRRDVRKILSDIKISFSLPLLSVNLNDSDSDDSDYSDDSYISE